MCSGYHNYREDHRWIQKSTAERNVSQGPFYISFRVRTYKVFQRSLNSKGLLGISVEQLKKYGKSYYGTSRPLKCVDPHCHRP